MRIAAVIALVCLLPAAALPVVQKKKGKKPAAASLGAKKGVAERGVTGRKATAPKTARKASRKSTRKTARSTWRARQTVPTPDRYKQIQEALASKGYLQASATGVWDSQSADALRRFQADQSLEPTGKLNSLSLIALGLGPKRETASAATAAAPR